MNKWKQELQELKLTTEKKQNLKKQMVQQPSISPKKGFYWPVIIAPAIVLLLAFCVLLLVTDSPNGTMHQASQPPNDRIETDHSNYFKLHMRLSLAISVGILVNSFMAILIVMKTKRWQQPVIQKLRNVFYKLRYVFTFLAPLLLYSFAVISFEIFTSEQAKINVIYLFVLLFVFLCMIFAARNNMEKVCCPHCQHEFSAKEKRKLMMQFKLDRNCHKCGGKLFYTKRTRQASGIISGVMSALLILPSNFGVSLWLALTCGISMSVTIMVVLLPLFLELEGEEKPLF
ncbi:MAG: TIGR04104 family putative zinc finger protein [Solibacillus sp.]